MRVHISTIPERSFLSLATGKPIALPLHSPYPLDGAPFRQTTAECPHRCCAVPSAGFFGPFELHHLSTARAWGLP